MALYFCDVYLMLGSKKLMCCHVHSTDTRVACGVVSYLRLYVVVTACCQFWRHSIEETAVSGEQLHWEVCHTACESVGALQLQSKEVAGQPPLQLCSNYEQSLH
jgi:hypothetical protein